MGCSVDDSPGRWCHGHGRRLDPNRQRIRLPNRRWSRRLRWRWGNENTAAPDAPPLVRVQGPFRRLRLDSSLLRGVLDPEYCRRQCLGRLLGEW
jgi:hypothetical protein